MKHMTILAVIVLMFGVVGFTQAQDALPVFCGDLADADCEILQQNQQAMQTLESFAFALTADFSISNIPDMPEAVSFGITGDGAVTGDMASLHRSPEDMMALATDPEAYANYMTSVIEAFDLDLSLVLNMPQALVEETGGEMPSTLPLNVVLADGVGYIDLSTLRDAVGEAGESFPEGWYGIDLSELVTQMMAMSDAMGSMDAMSAMDPSMFSQFTDPAFVGRFMTIERLEDTTAADGAAVASFHMSIDYAALMSDPAVQELIAESMTAQGATLSEEEMAQMQTMMSEMFQNITLEIFTTVGLDDFYTRSTQVTMNFDMQSMMAMAAEMGDNADMEGPAPVLMFNAVVTNSSFNEVAEIVAPENATIIPLESLGMMGDMSVSEPAVAVTVEAAEPMMQPTETPAK